MSAAVVVDCYYDCGPATYLAKWTVYGGGLRSRHLCDKHASMVRGQRGVELIRLEGPVA